MELVFQWRASFVFIDVHQSTFAGDIDPDQLRNGIPVIAERHMPTGYQQVRMVTMAMDPSDIRRSLPGGGPSFSVPDLWVPGATPGGRLVAESRAMLATIATIVRYRKGETIYLEGEKAVAVFNIITGMVKSYRRLPNGQKYIVGFSFANDLIGLPLDGRYVNAAEAGSAVTLYKISGPAVEARLRRHPELDFQVIGRLCHELGQSQDHAFLLSKRRAAAKLGLFLQMLEARQVLDGATSGEVFLPMNRSDIGSYAGISAEAVTRTLREFADRGVIVFRDRRHIHIIDRARLGVAVSESLHD
jgi:CRP/FNR family transcriptional regulator